MTPSLLLSSVIAGASTVILSDRDVPDVRRPERPVATAVGVSGRPPEQERLSPELLGRAARPSDFADAVEPELRPPEGAPNIPAPMLQAYRDAADQLASSRPDCGLDWSVLASIGRIESGHARSGQVDEHGVATPPIVGPRLDGSGNTAAVSDTDRGVWDGDPVWDRAVGPMQFLPATWRRHGVDGNGDDVADPHNVHDATRSAGGYLCSTGQDLRDPGELAKAVFRYNHSERYVREVLLWADAYAHGVMPTRVDPPTVTVALPSTTDASGRPPRPPKAPAVVAMPPLDDSRPAAVPPGDGAVAPNDQVEPGPTPSDTPPSSSAAPPSTAPPASSTTPPNASSGPPDLAEPPDPDGSTTSGTTPPTSTSLPPSTTHEPPTTTAAPDTPGTLDGPGTPSSTSPPATSTSSAEPSGNPPSGKPDSPQSCDTGPETPAEPCAVPSGSGPPEPAGGPSPPQPEQPG